MPTKKHNLALARLAKAEEYIQSGSTVNEAMAAAGMSAAFYYKHRKQPKTVPVHPKVKATPASPEAGHELNYCPHCGANLQAVKIAITL